MTNVNAHRAIAVPGTRDRASVRADLSRAVRALNLAQAADHCLKSGDDEALELLGFAPEHIATLRSSVRGARAGYPPYALRNLKATVRFLRTQLAEEETFA